jgi:hypothetical protein
MNLDVAAEGVALAAFQQAGKVGWRLSLMT